jgi:di/tricarboxylate transporter
MVMGNTLILVGIGLVLAGIAYKFGLLGWFGHLPGDIRYEGEHTFIFIPLTSMLLVSAVLSLIMWLAGR